MVFLVKSQFLSIVFHCFPMGFWQPGNLFQHRTGRPRTPQPSPAPPSFASPAPGAVSPGHRGRPPPAWPLASWRRPQAEKSETRAWETVAATGGEKTHNQGTKNVGKMETNWEIKGKMDYWTDDKWKSKEQTWDKHRERTRKNWEIDVHVVIYAANIGIWEDWQTLGIWEDWKVRWRFVVGIQR